VKVVAVPGSTKATLGDAALAWFDTNFKPKKATDLVQLNDVTNGMVVGKYTTNLTAFDAILSSYEYQLQYTVSLFLKDGKYKYEVTNLQLKPVIVSNGGLMADPYFVPAEKLLVDEQMKNGKPHKMHQDLKQRAQAHLTTVVASLEAAMQHAGA
jgi:uncharacterized protein YozE (UPF0346 family)